MLGKDNSPKPAALKNIEPKVDLVKNWSVPVGKNVKTAAYYKLKPVISKNEIFTASRSGEISARNRKSGQVLWTIKLDRNIVSGPAVNASVVAVGTEASDLVLLDRTNGHVLWKKKVSGEVLAKPTLSAQNAIAKTIDGNLYAFDIPSGDMKWQVNHGSPDLILKSSSSPVIVSNVVLAGFSDGKLDAVDLSSGRLLWRRSIVFPKGGNDVERLIDIDADPVVKGDIVYLASYQGLIGALSLSNGQFLWSRPASVYKNMLLKNNALYVTDSDDVVWAFNAQTGSVKWKQTELKARGLTEPGLMNNRVVVGDRQGFLHVLSADNGEILGRSSLASTISVAPTGDGKALYVQTDNGLLNELAVS